MLSSNTLATCRHFENELYDAQSLRRNEIEDDESIDEQTRSYPDGDATLRKIDGQIRALRSYSSALQDVHEFLNSVCCQAQYQNCILMVGEWGSGKTHYLCDIARSRLAERQPVLLVLAKDFEPHPNASSALVNHTGFSRNIRTLVNQLGRLSRNGERALLIVDGVNESDQNSWKTGVKELYELVRKKDNVALIISSRSPMYLGKISRRNTRCDRSDQSDIATP